MHLHFHSSFADANARYNINQNIDSMHENGSAVYSLFTYIYAVAVHMKEFDPNVLYLHGIFIKFTHFLTWVYLLLIYGYYFLIHLK